MLIPSFGVKRMNAIRPRLQGLVDRLLDDMLAKGPVVDLVSAFALPVPSMAICELLGVPYGDHDFFEESPATSWRRYIGGGRRGLRPAVHVPARPGRQEAGRAR